MIWTTDRTVGADMRQEFTVLEPLTPRPYQEEAIEKVSVGSHGGVLLGDPMGLGKTLVAVESLRRRDSSRNLIVAPLNTHDTWRDTILRQTGGQAHVLVHPPGSSTSDGANLFWRAMRAHTPGWFILGWQAFVGKATPEQTRQHKEACEKAKKENKKKPERKTNLEWWKTGEWQAVVLDECHRMSNHKSLSYKTANTLHTHFKIAMSGTPARNRVEGFWAVMSWLWPHLYHNKVPGAQSYYKWVKQNLLTEKVTYGPGLKILGEKPGRSITASMPMYVRREKEDVLDQLPPVITRTIEVPLLPGTQERAYRRMESEAVAWLGGQPLGARLDTIKFMRLRQIALGEPRVAYTDRLDADGCRIPEIDFAPDCRSNKIDVLTDLLTDIPEDEPVLVFTHSAKFARAVVHQVNAANLGPAALHTGEVPQAERNQIRRRFGHDIRVIVAGVGATGEGTDGLQQVCSKEIWLSEMDDNTINAQARERLHRSGQQRTVQRWYVHTAGTVDQQRHLVLSEHHRVMTGVYAAS